MTQDSVVEIIDDVELVASFQTGKTEDFGLLYDKYVHKIYDYIYFKTHHREIAEDLCSKTFLKCLEKLGTYQPSKGSFSSWLYRIATNTVIDHYRTQKSHANIEDAWDLVSGEDLLKDVENKDKFAEVEKLLKQLKPDQRDIVMLRIWSGLSYCEIAEIVGKSEDNCKMIFSRAVGSLRSELVLAFLLLFFGK
ncbi:MAG: sigma-70 family RNA polymerase sigma factor [Candidatus Moraniibacteriota bacterium]